MRPSRKDIEPRAPRRRTPSKRGGSAPGAAALEAEDDSLLGEGHFRRFAESSDDVFWLADLGTGRLLYVSPRVEALWGMAADTLLREPSRWNDAVLEDDAAQLPVPFFAEDPARDESIREYRIRSRSGELRWIRDRRFQLRGAAGGGRRIGGIAEDVTERKQREIECSELLQREREARSDAEAVALAKDEFLAVVTHELRSPLNAIRGWAHVLRHSGELHAGQLRALDAIDRNTQAQANLVDDLLDSQRILCGKLPLERGRVMLAAVIEEAADGVRPAAQGKRIRLDLSHDPAIGLVHVDPDRLRQAMLKLLSNAVKFTPDDGIVSVCSRRHAGGLAIDVHDTGVGLELSQLPLMFDRFQQGDSSSTRRASGLGLGLSLAQQLIELHGGGIRVDSPGPGRGSTFTIELPADALCEQPQQSATQASSASLAGKRVVIVEDDDDGREVLGLILRGAQIELRSFSRAAAAYDYLAHAPEHEQPDALISDIAMPEEDGYQFIRRVREMEGGQCRRRTVALALTSFARVEDGLRALKAGFDAHLAKPIDPQRVLNTLAEILRLAPGRHVPA
jgi:PAS domain S-box-containing protein